MIKLVQVCNVGRITGGTGACAWSVTRALPEWEHEVLCLSRVTEEMRRVFGGVRVRNVEGDLEEEIAKCGGDLVLLHNISRRHVGRCPESPTVNYLHSKIDPAPCLRRVVCSEWLRKEYGGEIEVLMQGVPRPPRDWMSGNREGRGFRELRREMVVGRICTPTARKWWEGLPEFTRAIAERCEGVRWEFVGCPMGMRGELARACGGEARFFEASWEARGRLWEWDVLLYHHPTLVESFGRTVGEACRAGCIPVVDRAGGFLEQLAGGPGYLCSGVEEFAGALEDLRDCAVRWRMSRACRAWGEERFSLRGFRGRLLGVFGGVLQENSRGSVNQAARR